VQAKSKMGSKLKLWQEGIDIHDIYFWLPHLLYFIPYFSILLNTFDYSEKKRTPMSVSGQSHELECRGGQVL